MLTNRQLIYYILCPFKTVGKPKVTKEEQNLMPTDSNKRIGLGLSWWRSG